MLDEHKRCPECDTYDREVVYTEWYAGYVERVRICEECPAQYTVNYGNPYIENVELIDQ